MNTYPFIRRHHKYMPLYQATLFKTADKIDRDPTTIRTLTHRGRVTHTCVVNLGHIGSDNGLSPVRRQAITWTNFGILLIGPLGTNFNEMLIEIHTFSLKKIHLKMSSGKWRPSCLGLSVLRRYCVEYYMIMTGTNFMTIISEWIYLYDLIKRITFFYMSHELVFIGQPTSMSQEFSDSLLCKSTYSTEICVAKWPRKFDKNHV